MFVTFVYGQNSLVEKEFPVNQFTALSVSSGVDVYLIEGSGHQVLVETNAKKMDKMKIKQSGERLSIGMDNKGMGSWSNLKKQPPVKVYVTFRILNSLDVSGGSDIYSKETIHANPFTLEASGGSDIHLDIETNQMSCSLSGGSDLFLGGLVKKLEANMSGAADIKAKNCKVDDLEVTMSGASDMQVSVSSRLHAKISGSSDLFVYGNPEIVHKSVSGSSDFHLNKN